MQPLKILMIIDSINTIIPKKDSSLAILLAASNKGYILSFCESKNLSIENNYVFVYTKKIKVFDNTENWYSAENNTTKVNILDFDIVFMRKNPPFNMEYIYATYLLEYANHPMVINPPKILRNYNEKLFSLQFNNFIPKTLLSADITQIKEFIYQQKQVVVKPLDGFSGKDIFLLKDKDINTNNTLVYLTNNSKKQVMVQEYIPEVMLGDKRILIIDGKPVPYSLTRIPAKDNFLGNIAQGASIKVEILSQKDKQICQELKPVLQKLNILFVGIDVIGGYLTEINITSPTGIRELDRICNLDIATDLLKSIEKYI